MSEGNEQCSFGIKKIVDCKIDETGKQLYKVKWEATWEPAENLSSCQHLIDEFWGFVNKAKSNEDTAQQCRKKIRLDHDQNNGSAGFGAHALSEDSKEEVQRLIARTNATQPGNPPNLMTPSEMLNNTQQNHMGMPRTPTRAPQSPFSQNSRNPYSQSPNHFGQQQQQQQFGSPQQNFGSSSQMNSPSSRGKAPGFGKPSSIKSEQDDSNSPKKASGLSALKFLESFENPYVRVSVFCKVCSKEQSLKYQHTWKRHFLTHSSKEDLPNKCPTCGQGFITTHDMRKHIERKHKPKAEKVKAEPKTEPNFNIAQFPSYQPQF